MIEEMLANNLLSHGVLGLWCLVLLYDKYNYQKKITKTIDNNTKELTLFREFIKDYIRNGRNK